MSKINISVEITYRVELSNVEVDDKMAQLFVQYCHEEIDPTMAKDGEAKVADWIANNIKEEDWCDYKAEIDDLYIDGEPY